MKLLLVALAVACAVLLADAAFAAPADVRWGQFRIARLKEKLAEDRTDLAEGKKELAAVRAFAKKAFGISKRICAARLHRARLAVQEWKSIVQLRGGSVKYHTARHPKYTAAHKYAKRGPQALHDFVKKCLEASKATASASGATSRSACAKQWAAQHPKAFARWQEARKEYFAGNYTAHLRKHKTTTQQHEQRSRAAARRLRRVRAHFRDLRNACQDGIKKSGQRLAALVGKFQQRVAWLAGQVKSLSAAFKSLKQQRADREKQYREFYLTKCQHIGGKHHTYWCTLDTNNSDKTKFRFLNCEFRQRSPQFISVMYFRCRK